MFFFTSIAHALSEFAFVLWTIHVRITVCTIWCSLVNCMGYKKRMDSPFANICNHWKLWESRERERERERKRKIAVMVTYVSVAKIQLNSRILDKLSCFYLSTLFPHLNVHLISMHCISWLTISSGLVLNIQSQLFSLSYERIINSLSFSSMDSGKSTLYLLTYILMLARAFIYEWMWLQSPVPLQFT